MNVPVKVLCRAISLILLSSPLALPIQAATVTVTGAAGTQGANGIPGMSSGNGGVGGEARALANEGADNRAEAIGGRGGDGGGATDMTVPLGTPGSEGGLAGAGGAATAWATSSGSTGSVVASASAQGGVSGVPGFPSGQDGLPPEFFLSLPPASDGGSATAYGHGTAGGDAQSLTVTAQAVGGRATDTTFPFGTLVIGSGQGGDAQSSAFARATNNSAVSASASATGGTGTFNMVRTGGNGGHAYVSSYAENAGNQALFSEATAVGGAGGEGAGGGVGGQAIASADAASTGGGAVTVSATQVGGSGGNAVVFFDSSLGLPRGTPADGTVSIMDGRVHGATSGKLTLLQKAVGGNGGAGDWTQWGNDLIAIDGAKGGDAFSNISQTHGGSGLAGKSEAVGGKGGEGANGGNGGHARADIALTGVDKVEAEAVAEGGAGGGTYYGLGGQGGDAFIGRAYGQSTGGGDVSVSARAKGGDSASRGAGRGGQALIDNAVSGDTTGALMLSQSAIGGNATGNLGGSATSLLKTTTDRASSLTMQVSAQGGAGKGAAKARGEGTISSGSLELSVLATGGEGGGQSVAEALGTMSGDGRTLLIKADASGGDAKASTSAIAVGNSDIDATASALGSHGGTASAEALANNDSAGWINNRAIATGANGGSEGAGGAAGARAWAVSTGGGDIWTSATQTGGDGAIGADSIMLDQVGGHTSGRLWMNQTAIGGASNSWSPGGAADSRLTVKDTAAREVRAFAAGFGGMGGGQGGAGRADINVQASGDVYAIGLAVGGRSSTGAGGNGESRVIALSTGTATTVSASGEARSSYSGFDASTGRWGNAKSFSSGQGNAAVSVTDQADAGNGSFAGKAQSEARATSLGAGPVAARASAQGKDSEVSAVAQTQAPTGPVQGILASAYSRGHGQMNAQAQAGFINLPAGGVEFGDADGAFAIGAPGAELVSAVVDGPNVKQHLQGSEVLGLGALQHRVQGWDDLSGSIVRFSFDTSAFADGSQLLIGFTDASTLGSWSPYGGFEVKVSVGGVSVFQHQYTNGGAALADLNDRTLELGDWSAWTSNGESLLDVELALSGFSGNNPNYNFPNTLFSLGFVVASAPAAVPVPAAAWLLGSGLAGLAAVGRRRARAGQAPG